jgi:CRISPR-associated protein Csb1
MFDPSTPDQESSMPRRETYTFGLEPALGSRFQPTGFPNLGAAEFVRPVDDDGWERCLLVESEQSMANRLEATLWDQTARAPIDTIAELPHLVWEGADGQTTSSRLEAHRIASPYFGNAQTADGRKGTDWINERLGLDDDRLRAPFEFAEGLFSLDPLCLVHGVFLSAKAFKGNPRVARAITANVEAYDVREAFSGGVKKDSVRTGAGRGTDEGYGMVPFPRTEWTARRIEAHVAIDLDQIASYRLSNERRAVLEALARYEVAALFTGNLRLRTACDLQVTDGEVPSLDDATAALRDAVAGLDPADRTGAHVLRGGS